ncbi:hypothetical protein BTJ39_06635 [Izhakiella australiensis]|uniref:DUF2000 domain-containing protein n=1 Tax=Izhakiella australiensis TaxID=1926881 RepID=A0A1S8YPG3_9GAMM|nr:DUF2000 domain-containing protein [Izhakiella australiensis]OON40752.1 hypothetical protein BTJ39_06635 [Izhakiella australiensis]
MKEERCVLIINPSLAPGKTANAAAVMALTVGQRHPHLVGPALTDGSGLSWPGLIPTGIPVLSATPAVLSTLLSSVLSQNFDVVIFPEQGQMTTDYAAFSAAVAEVTTDALPLLGIAVTGEKKALRKFTAGLSLFA